MLTEEDRSIWVNLNPSMYQIMWYDRIHEHAMSEFMSSWMENCMGRRGFPDSYANLIKRNIIDDVERERLEKWEEGTGLDSLGMFTVEGAQTLHAAILFVTQEAKNVFCSELTPRQFDYLMKKVNTWVTNEGHYEVNDTAVHEMIPGEFKRRGIRIY